VSTAPQLAPRVRELLVKLLWLTDSPNPHEREVAREKFFALLAEHRVTPADVLAPPPVNTVVQIVHPSAPPPQPQQRPPPRRWSTVAQEILTTRADRLRGPKEVEFVRGLLARGYYTLTEKQRLWLADCANRCRVAPWDVAP
jgi:hypothetical protein